MKTKSFVERIIKGFYPLANQFVSSTKTHYVVGSVQGYLFDFIAGKPFKDFIKSALKSQKEKNIREIEKVIIKSKWDGCKAYLIDAVKYDKLKSQLLKNL